MTVAMVSSGAVTNKSTTELVCGVFAALSTTTITGVLTPT